MEDAAAACMLRHFLVVLEDEGARPILQAALDAATRHCERIAELFAKEGIPVPVGFTDKDWNPHAPRLFSDAYALRYLKHLGSMGAAGHSLAHSLSTRADVRGFYRSNAESSGQLLDMVVDYMLEKGFYVRPPTMAYPEKAEFVEKQTFLSSLLGRHRPLLAVEICHLSKNIETNLIGETLLLGFAQTAKTKGVETHLRRGREIALKHVHLFREMLLEDDLSTPSTSDSVVSESTDAPWSEKLMMFVVSSITALGIGNYGASLSTTMRTDIAAMYTRLAGEVLLYAEDGVNLMIDRGWLEQPPQTVDRRALTATT
ncbi:DUF3231 family protein [Paenibacillus sp. TRM 82003]|nr:DUF3231 family protein [Paenibacillus sp. TRM 82003]